MFQRMVAPYRRYFDFSGRSCRKEYWLFHLALVILIVCLIVVGEVADSSLASNQFSNVGFSIFGLVFLVSVIPHLAVTIRRFHDQGLSGWYYLWSFFPYIGGLIQIYYMVQKGTPGENGWGQDPLEAGVDTDIFA